MIYPVCRCRVLKRVHFGVLAVSTQILLLAFRVPSQESVCSQGAQARTSGDKVKTLVTGCHRELRYIFTVNKAVGFCEIPRKL